MGFRFRRSIKILPGLRLNLSGSGASVSVGPRGFHYTVGPKGTRVTAGIPGTGLSWSEYTPHARSRSEPHISGQSFQDEPTVQAGEPIDPNLTAIENAPAEEINAFSATELAPILDAAHRKLRFAPLIQLLSILVFVAALFHASQLSLGLSALYATVFVPIAIFLDRYRRSVKIDYVPQGPTAQIAHALADSFEDLIACNSTWSIRAEGNTADWKRNAGATTLSRRKKADVRFDKPSCISGNSKFPALRLGKDEIYLLPDAALIIVGGSVAAVHYRDLEVSHSKTRFIEEDDVPADSPIVGQTWRYVNKKGGPDRRFNFNKELPICVYGEMSFRSEGGLNCKIHCSNPAAPDRLSNVIEVLHRSSAELPKAITYIKTAKRWPSILFFAAAAVFGAAQFAFFPTELFSSSFQQTAAPAVSPDQNQASPVRPQPTVAQPVNRPEQRNVQQTMGTPAAPRPVEPIEIVPAKPVATVPLPRPRPKFQR
jgi:hypothetical protein